MSQGASLVMGIDLGTQSTKVLVYDPRHHTVLAVAQAPHELIVGEQGEREQRAAWWLTALHDCMAQIPASVAKQVGALGVSGQQHGFVPVGDDGKVLGNVKLWCDTSTVAECDWLHERLGGALGAVELAGNPILPGYTASKVLWFKRHQPALYAKLRMILLPHDYLNFYLTGRYVMEAGDASGTGFFDVRTRRWSQPVLAAIDAERDLSELLPRLIAPQEAAGSLQAQVAAELGLRPGIPVAAGGGDNMMGAIGTGAVAPGKLTISLGTSGTLYAYTATPLVSPKQEFAAFCSSTGGYLPLLCTMNCTSATQVMRELLQIPLSEFDSLLESSAIGASGITALPFFSGERTPDVPRGQACLFGLTTANSNRAHLLRAVVESTVFGLRSGLNAMRALGLSATEASLIGGGASSQAWAQIVADALQLRVVRPLQPESAAFGAALQALWCVKHASGEPVSIEELATEHVATDPNRNVQPVPEHVASYDAVFQRYQQLLAVVQELYR